MSIDDEIKHLEEVAENNEELARSYYTDENVYMYAEERCNARAEECRQLVKWLKEYKRLFGAIEEIKQIINNSNLATFVTIDYEEVVGKYISKEVSE